MNQYSCVICLESYSTNPNKPVCRIPCGHIFHKSCLEQFFRTQRQESYPTTCPTCRQPIASNQIIGLFGNESYGQSRQTINERSRLLNEPGIDKSWRKVYGWWKGGKVKLLATFGFLILATFYSAFKQFICEHYFIIAFSVIFMYFLISAIIIKNSTMDSTMYSTMYSYDDSDFNIRNVEIRAVCSIFYLSAFTIGNIWNLKPCVFTFESHPFESLILAIGITLLSAINLKLIAFRMNWNLTDTRNEAILGLGLSTLIICFIIFAFTIRDNVVCIFLQSLCLIIFSLYLIFFTQLVKRYTHNRAKEYIFLATGLYVSIINIFIFTLRIIGEANPF